MFCINCGKPLPEDSRFCPYCGTPVIFTAAAEAAEEAGKAAEEKVGEIVEAAGEVSSAAEEKLEELAAAAEDKEAQLEAIAAEMAEKSEQAAKEALLAGERKEEEIAEALGELSGAAEEKAEELIGLAADKAETLSEKMEEITKDAAETAGELSAAAEEKLEELAAAAEDKEAQLEAMAAEMAEKSEEAAKETLLAGERKEEEIAEALGELSGAAEEKAEELVGLSSKTVEDISEEIENAKAEAAEEAGELSAAAEERIEALEAAAAEKFEDVKEAVEKAAEAADSAAEAAEKAAEAAADKAEELAAENAEAIENAAEAGPDWSLTKEAAQAAEAAGMDPEEAAKVEATESAKAAAAAAAATAAAAAATAAAKEEKKSNKTAKILSVIVILALIAGAAGYYFYQNSAPVKLKKLQANVDQLVAAGNYEDALSAYKEALGTGLDDAAIEQGIEDTYLDYLRTIADYDIIPREESMALTNRIADECPDITDDALAILQGVLEREMQAARAAGDFTAAKSIYSDAIIKYPTISDGIRDMFNDMKEDKAYEIFSSFMTEEAINVMRSGTMEQVRDYMEQHDVRGMINELSEYHFGDIVIDAPGTSGLRVGKHSKNSTIYFYIGEYNGDIPNGKGIRVCYVIDKTVGTSKYIVERLSSEFKYGIPTGEFAERFMVQSNDHYEYVVKGSTRAGNYDGPITVEYDSGAGIITLKGEFDNGHIVDPQLYADSSKYASVMTEDGSAAITTDDPNKEYGTYPEHSSRFL